MPINITEISQRLKQNLVKKRERDWFKKLTEKIEIRNLELVIPDCLQLDTVNAAQKNLPNLYPEQTI